MKLFTKQKFYSAHIKANKETRTPRRGYRKALLELLLNITYRARNSICEQIRHDMGLAQAGTES